MRKVFHLSPEIGRAIELTSEEESEARVGYIATSCTRDYHRKQIKVARILGNIYARAYRVLGSCRVE